MKVLMVSKSQVAGAYRGKLAEIARLGVDLTVITPPRWGNQEFEAGPAEGYTLRVLPCVLSGYTHFHFYAHRTEPIDADLVYLEEEPWSLVTYQFLRRCVREHKPAIVFTWQNIYKRYPPPFSFFERFTFEHTEGAIAGSDDAAAILAEKGYRKPVWVIPQLGVDPEQFRRRNVPALRAQLQVEGKFVLGFIGRLVEEKGIYDLMRALALLPEACVLVMVGEGKQRTAAGELAARLGLSTRIRWVPQVSSLDIPQYMSLIDVLVLPSRTTSRWKEQFGRVLIEAMACETVPVGSSSGEIPKVIGEAGLIFPEGDVDALADRVLALYADADRLALLRRMGRARVVQRFTHRKIAEQVVQCYSQVLGGRSEHLEPALTKR